MSSDYLTRLANAQTCPMRRQAISTWLMNQPEARNSTRAYRYAIKQWLDWSNNLEVDWLDPSLDDAIRYSNELVLKVDRNTVSVRLAGIRHFYGALREARLTKNGVFHSVMFGVERRERAGYYPGEVAALLAASGVQDRAWLLLIVENGIRPSALCRLTWANVTHDHRLTVGAKSVPLSPQAAEAIHALPRRSGRILGFGTTGRMRRRLAALARRANVTYRGVDVLRRYAQ